ncbi:MAG: flagellar hook-basal body complex protein [Negativicutes bacterium]|nr:flagellar hook-basal body complex protein [Negativicutes bacterium]
MMRSLYAGVSGLNLHQTRMDVLGNNIANINTNGFKASRANFAQMYTQTLSSGSPAGSGMGGTNPTQIGLGVNLGSIDMLFEQGSLQSTGRINDVAIQGNGLFAVNANGQKLYTRNGNFAFDSQGNYVVQGLGYRVQGWLPGPDGKIVPGATTVDIKVDTGNIPGTKSTSLTVSGNLQSTTAIGGAASIPSTIYSGADSGASMLTSFTKIADRTWIYSNQALGGSVVNPTGLGQVVFNSNGAVDSMQLIRPSAERIGGFTNKASINNIQLNSEIGSTGVMGFSFYTNEESAPVLRTVNLSTTLDSVSDAGTIWSYGVQATDGGTANALGTTAQQKVYQVTDGNKNYYFIRVANQFLTSQDTIDNISAGALANLSALAGMTVTTANMTTSLPAFEYKPQGSSMTENISLSGANWVTGVAGPGTFNMTTVPPVALTSATSDLTIKSLQLDSTLNSLHTMYYTVIDANSVPRVFKFDIQNVSSGNWSYTITEMGNESNKTAGSIKEDGIFTPNFINFQCNGQTYRINISTPEAVVTAAPGMFAINYVPQFEVDNNSNSGILTVPTAGSAPMPLQFKNGGLTQYDSATNLGSKTDGTSTGSLLNTTIDQRGIIVGTYSNGTTKDLAQIAVAYCDNPAGLQQYANTFYLESQNSGKVTCNAAGSGGRGQIQAGALEMSNVDLASAFSDMIVTQRGFQANTKIISTTSDMLQDLVNLKR